MKGKMNMSYKTREELMKEIENKNDEIKNLKEEIKKLDRITQYTEGANELAALRDSFVAAGFTKSEATTLTIEMMKNAVAMTNTGKFTYRKY
jgi:predicted nuclease with TOPRIM domain